MEVWMLDKSASKMPARSVLLHATPVPVMTMEPNHSVLYYILQLWSWQTAWKSRVLAYLGFIRNAGETSPGSSKREPHRQQTQQDQSRKEARPATRKRRSTKRTSKERSGNAATKGMFHNTNFTAVPSPHNRLPPMFPRTDDRLRFLFL